MTDPITSYYQTLLEDDFFTQIGNLFFWILMLYILGKLLRFIYLIATGKLQKATVLGFKRRARSFGSLLFTTYDPFISYKGHDGKENQKILKRVPLQNIIAIDVFVFPAKAKFINVVEIGIHFLLGGVMTILCLALFFDVEVTRVDLVFFIVLVMLIFAIPSASQLNYADKALPGLNSWKQMKEDKQITKNPLTEDEYLNLITPEKLLTYEEAKRLEAKEGLGNAVLTGGVSILLITLILWDIFSK